MSTVGHENRAGGTQLLGTAPTGVHGLYIHINMIFIKKNARTLSQDVHNLFWLDDVGDDCGDEDEMKDSKYARHKEWHTQQNDMIRMGYGFWALTTPNTQE